MSSTKTIIKGTGKIGKGKGVLQDNFVQIPMELFDYLQLELITRTDITVYIRLCDFYNEEYGYAFPTIPQLMLATRIGSKTTIHKSIEKLEEVGLIRKSKTNRGNNTYVIYKPLSKSELYDQVPDKVEQFKEFVDKVLKMSGDDKQRFQIYQQNKQAQEQKEQAIQAKQIEPTVETFNNEIDEANDDMENLSFKEWARLARGVK
ncbi:helix-turn-helix domain-containing protein [Sporosarcina sp. HYO08]|uniref:helix-turn-helix domain-containing protein n=1 Tax=Sporosarcina sp. HYO08 TaxID=1759557 RepID=UPI0007999EC3|nr:helix-turn-helix domain-containing protein [Sporosarcina sp. HYO08]KXH83729.1 transcriptional regulator [Sporosarcina sp. HYO08]